MPWPQGLQPQLQPPLLSGVRTSKSLQPGSPPASFSARNALRCSDRRLMKEVPGVMTLPLKEGSGGMSSGEPPALDAISRRTCRSRVCAAQEGISYYGR